MNWRLNFWVVCCVGFLYRGGDDYKDAWVWVRLGMANVLWCKGMGIAMWGLCSMGGGWELLGRVHAFIRSVCLFLNNERGVVCVFAIGPCFVELFGWHWGWCSCTWREGEGMCQFLVVAIGCKEEKDIDWARWCVLLGCACIDHIVVWGFVKFVHWGADRKWLQKGNGGGMYNVYKEFHRIA